MAAKGIERVDKKVQILIDIVDSEIDALRSIVSVLRRSIGDGSISMDLLENNRDLDDLIELASDLRIYEEKRR